GGRGAAAGDRAVTVMEVLCLSLAFILGSLPFSQLIAKRRGVDLRSVGSGNVGATNLARVLGYGAGATGLLLDAAKGAAAVGLARVILGAAVTPAVTAGHVALVFDVLDFSAL